MEQRRYQRVPYTEEVLVNDSIMVKGLNLSEGGLYVHTGRSFIIDSVVTLKFVLGKKELNVKAQVKSSQQSIGMGLCFVDLSESDRAVIRDYVSGLLAKAADQRKRVLLVDDNEGARRMNKSKLVLDGFMVMEANDGIEAISRLQGEDIPDIVVLDLYMEKMDGYKVLAYMKGTDCLKHIPVIILSARATPAEKEHAMASGASGFLAKNMTSPVKLSEQIKKTLGT